MSVYHGPSDSYGLQWEAASSAASSLAEMLAGAICLWDPSDATGKSRVWFGEAAKRQSCSHAAEGEPACAGCLEAVRLDWEEISRGLKRAWCDTGEGVFFRGIEHIEHGPALCATFSLPADTLPSQVAAASDLLCKMGLQSTRLTAVRRKWSKSSDQVCLATELTKELGKVAKRGTDRVSPRGDPVRDMVRAMARFIALNTRFGACCIRLDEDGVGTGPLTVCGLSRREGNCQLLANARGIERPEWRSLEHCPDDCVEEMAASKLSSVCVLPLVPPFNGPIGTIAAFSEKQFLGNQITDSDVDTVEVMAAIGAGMVANALYKEQREVNRLQSEFLRKVTHELRTPLASVRSIAEMLLDPAFDAELLSEDQTEFAERILENAEIALGMVKSSLYEARLDAGAVPFQPTTFFASQAIAKLEKREFAVYLRRHELEFSSDSTDENAETWAEHDSFMVVMRNLIGNAAKYTPRGGSIRVHIAADETVGTTVTVRDTGSGFDAKVKGRIFDSFYQGPPPVDGRGGGVGYGLSLVKRLMERHEGTVTVESEPGKGTAFTVRFPPASEDTTETQEKEGKQ